MLSVWGCPWEVFGSFSNQIFGRKDARRTTRLIHQFWAWPPLRACTKAILEGLVLYGARRKNLNILTASSWSAFHLSSEFSGSRSTIFWKPAVVSQYENKGVLKQGKKNQLSLLFRDLQINRIKSWIFYSCINIAVMPLWELTQWNIWLQKVIIHFLA